MSKVICDVCGTAFAETAAQCPICGSAKASANQTEAGAQQGSQPAAEYTYVKGGRFSKSNVRKRNKKGKMPERRAAPERRSAPERQPQKKNTNDDKANGGLVAVVVILLLAIVAVVIYIAVRILGPSVGNNEQTKPSQTDPPTQQTQETTLPEVPCTGLELSHKLIELSNAGEAWLLTATPTPADTTDKIVMTSADENVATVSETGNVVAVGGGETVITVTCGSVTVECTVICRFGDPTVPSDPTTPTTSVDPVEELKFNTIFKDESTGKYDTTLTKKGETWKAYNGSISPLEITWVSDNENVCTIVNGVVTAIGRGQTEVHAQYKGVTVSCIVRCVFPADPEPTQPADPNTPDEPTQPTEPEVRISHEDVTLRVAEKFTLTLKKGAEVLEVEWKADKEGVVTIEGNKITGVAENLVGVKVSAVYEEQTYTCIVRVDQP